MPDSVWLSPSLTFYFVEGDRFQFHSGDLVRVHDLDAADLLFKNQPSVWAHPCAFASSDMDRVAAGSMYRKRPPVSCSQKFPDSVRHTIRLSPKRDSYKQPKVA